MKNLPDSSEIIEDNKFKAFLRRTKIKVKAYLTISVSLVLSIPIVIAVVKYSVIVWNLFF